MAQECRPTSILVLDGKPIAHSFGDQSELLDILLEECGKLRFIYGDDVVAEADDVEALAEWTDIHAGTLFPVVQVERADAPGAPFDFYIIEDPWYIYEIDDVEERERIQEYCCEYGLEIA